jgi:hypothetical protein
MTKSQTVSFTVLHAENTTTLEYRKMSPDYSCKCFFTCTRATPGYRELLKVSPSLVIEHVFYLSPTNRERGGDI